MNSLLQKLHNASDKLTIAVDGPAASGKGHISKMLSKKYNLNYIDSGLLYRHLAYLYIKEIGGNIAPIAPESEVNYAVLTNALSNISYSEAVKINLNKEEVAAIASKLAKLELVRENISSKLKEIANKNLRIIMDGRDIASVIMPEADVKLYISANVEIRAERRYKQLLNEGKACMLCDVLELLKKRDEGDSTRKLAPLVISSSSIVIDTSDLTPDDVIKTILKKLGDI